MGSWEPSVIGYARSFALLRKKSVALRESRAGYYCKREGYETVGSGDRRLPCWKTWLDPDDPQDGRVRLDESEWCDPCVNRAVVHKAYQATNRQRGAALRLLLQACGKLEKELGRHG